MIVDNKILAVQCSKVISWSTKTIRCWCWITRVSAPSSSSWRTSRKDKGSALLWWARCKAHGSFREGASTWSGDGGEAYGSPGAGNQSRVEATAVPGVPPGQFHPPEAGVHVAVLDPEMEARASHVRIMSRDRRPCRWSLEPNDDLGPTDEHSSKPISVNDKNVEECSAALLGWWF